MKLKNSILLLIVISAAVAAASIGTIKSPSLEVTVGEEVTVLPGGVFPFLFCSRAGTLVVNGYIYPNQGTHNRPGFAKPLPGPGIPITVRSTDGGSTWQIWAPDKGVGINAKTTPKLAAVCDHEYCSGLMGPATQGSMVQLRDGTILINDYHPEALTDGRFVGRIWRSTDDWKTVQGPEETYVNIPEAVSWTVGDNNARVPGFAFWGPPLELPDGVLLATMYGRFRQDNTGVGYTEDSTVQAPDMKKFRAIVVRSEDQGRNWTYLSTIAAGDVGEEGFDEPSMIRLTQGKNKGRLICVMRTGRRSHLYQAVSDDHAKTWSTPKKLELVGVAPSLIEMRSGVLALAFGHKPDYGDVGNFVAFSLDQGDTWTNITRLSSGLSGAYTSIREFRPGELVAVYDERAYHKPLPQSPTELKDPKKGPSPYGSVIRRIFARFIKVQLDTASAAKGT